MNLSSVMKHGEKIKSVKYKKKGDKEKLKIKFRDGGSSKNEALERAKGKYKK